jgi:lysophospholipase L1-like esterase
MPGSSVEMKARRTRRYQILAAIALSLFGLFLVLEVFLRVAGFFYQARFWEDAGLSHGVAEGGVTILTMGESTTGGLWLKDRKDSYPLQLQRLLRAHYQTDRVRVLNPPHTGQNTSQMVARFDEYLAAFRPAVVIIMAGVNNGWSLAESNLGEFMPGGSWRTHVFRIRRWADDIKTLRLIRLAISGTGEMWRSMQLDLSGGPRYTQWPPPNNPLVEGIGSEPFVQLWRSDVGQMIEKTQAAGAGLVLMTYPNYDVPVLSEFEAMAASWSVPLVENHKSFETLEEQGHLDEYFFDDMRHPNAKGYAIVAENAFRAVLATGVLDGKLSAPE